MGLIGEIMISVDVANNLTGFILGLMTIFGSLIGLVVKAVTQHHEVQQLKIEVKDLNDELSKTKAEVAQENLRLEGKFDALQITVSQVLQGVSRIQGTLDARSDRARTN